MPPEALSELRGLHLPEAPGFFPPAPGWWLLTLVIIVVAFVLRRQYVRSKRAMRPVRWALVDLDLCNSALKSGALAPMRYLDQVNALLKRLLIHGYGETSLSSISSDGWIRALDQFLQRSSKSDTGVRLETALLGEFRYRPHSHRETSADLQDDLKSACEQLGDGLEVVIGGLTPPEATP